MWADDRKRRNETGRGTTGGGQGTVAFGARIGLVILAIAVFSVGCAHRPGPAPEPWSQLARAGTDALVARAADAVAAIGRLNPLLAAELGRLPEFGESLSPGHVKALETLLALVRENPARCEQVLKQMMAVGRAETRRYCAPLQALVWLVLDGQKDQARHLLAHYSLPALLCAAWPGPALVAVAWPQGRIEMRAGPCQARPAAYFLVNSLEPADILLLEQAGRLPVPQPGKMSWETLRAACNQRWSDPDTVAERLQAPELIDHYLRSQIRYDYYLGGRKTNAEVIATGRANCTDNAELAQVLLRRCGYEAEIVTIAGAGPNRDEAHQLVKFSDRGRIFIMDNGRTDPQGIVGPLNSLEGMTFWLNN